MAGCTCDICKAMCQEPCWPSPDEAQGLIDAGYSERLMPGIWWRVEEGAVHVLSPSRQANRLSKRCTFQDRRGLCELHDLGLKPMEGRLARCDDNGPHFLREKVVETWDNIAAQTLAKKWREEHDC